MASNKTCVRLSEQDIKEAIRDWLDNDSHPNITLSDYLDDNQIAFLISDLNEVTVEITFIDKE